MKMVKTVLMYSVLLFCQCIVMDTVCAFANSSMNKMNNLSTGYYYIEKISVSCVDSSDNKFMQQKYSRLLDEMYFYYDASEPKLTVYSIDNVGVSQKVLHDPKSGEYTTEIIKTAGIYDIIKNEREKIAPVDATHFIFSFTDYVLFYFPDVTMRCAKIAEDAPKLVAIRKNMTAIGKDIAEHFDPKRKKYAKYDFSIQQGMVRNFSFGQIILPVSAKARPNWSSHGAALLSPMLPHITFDSKQIVHVLDGFESTEMVIAFFEGSQSLFDWDEVIKKEVARPDYLLYREANGILFYDIRFNCLQALYHYYDPEKNRHVVARSIPQMKKDDDRTLKNYRFMRTVNPTVREKESFGIDLSALVEKSGEDLTKNFVHSYTSTVFLTQDAITSMLKRAASFENLVNKYYSESWLKYETDIRKDHDPKSGTMQCKYSRASIEESIAEITKDGSKIVYRNGPYCISAMQDDKMYLTAHYIVNKHGFTLHICYLVYDNSLISLVVYDRSPLAAINFIQQLRKMCVPQLPDYSDIDLVSVMGKYDSAKALSGREGLYIVSQGFSEGLLSRKGEFRIPLKYRSLKVEPYGYSAYNDSPYGEKVYFNMHGDIIPDFVQ
ncbi:hypothetical protein [Halodesulfovibrio aestuarii]|uniref:hypothetical protein n=1 Tax=Halodesulfovibrio aestuarii TaxID=126333 RepID=UPI003D3521DD